MTVAPLAAAWPTPRDYFTPSENARRLQRVLTRPLVDVRELIDVDVIVPQGFIREGSMHAVQAHPDGIKVRNARILFDTPVWEPRWQLPLAQQPESGISSHVCGLVLPGVRAPDIDGLHIEGSPSVGLLGWDIAGMRLRRYSATRCFYGAHFSERTPASSYKWLVEGVRIWDMWGGPGHYPSRVRPGGWVGGDCWVSNGSLHRLRRMEFSGEMFCGAKICDGTGVLVDGMVTPSLMFQARSGPRPTEQDSRTLTGLIVRDLALNAATGYGAIADGGNKVQISWGVSGSFDGGYIVGNGRDGNAMQITGDCHVEVHGVAFGGFNGVRGGLPACALELDVRDPISTVNDDFLAANRFTNQAVRLRRAA